MDGSCQGGSPQENIQHYAVASEKLEIINLNNLVNWTVLV